MGDPVVYFEIMGTDGDVLERFYGGLFGWQITPVEGPAGGYRRVRTGGAGGIDGGIGAFPGAPPYVTFYVHAPDIQASVDRAIELGGEILAPPREVTPGVRAAVLRDPEGHVVGLIDDPAYGG